MIFLSIRSELGLLCDFPLKNHIWNYLFSIAKMDCVWEIAAKKIWVKMLKATRFVLFCVFSRSRLPPWLLNKSSPSAYLCISFFNQNLFFVKELFIIHCRGNWIIMMKRKTYHSKFTIENENSKTWETLRPHKAFIYFPS